MFRPPTDSGISEEIRFPGMLTAESAPLAERHMRVVSVPLAFVFQHHPFVAPDGTTDRNPGVAAPSLVIEGLVVDGVPAALNTIIATDGVEERSTIGADRAPPITMFADPAVTAMTQSPDVDPMAVADDACRHRPEVNDEPAN